MLKKWLGQILKFIFVLFLLLSVTVFGYMKWNDLNSNELALILFTKVKDMQGKTVNVPNFETKERALVNHQIWSDLLAKHVSIEGKVDYNGFFKNQDSLNLYLDTLSLYPPGSNWQEADKLAYWINVYNAFTIKLILNHYPLKSIKDISDGLPMINSPWDIKFFKIGDTDFDLNTVEHEILRKQFDAPLMHFAINCASISCPNLRNEAYEAQKLEQQLEEQAITFLNDSDKNIITFHQSKVSMIFNWFESDFEKKVSVKTFIKQYNTILNKELDLEYLEYDWGLNE